MHTEVHVQTVCKLVCHESHYLQPEVVNFTGGFVEQGSIQKQKKAARLHATYANLEKANSQHIPSGSDIVRETFIPDCLETTQSGTYCNMWHVRALSSVLRLPVRSIYPDYNHYIRPLLNRVVMPRKEVQCNAEQCPINIMWTRAGPMCTHGPWSPNHFVPCICIQSDQYQDTFPSELQCHKIPQAIYIQPSAPGGLIQSLQGSKLHSVPPVSSRSRVSKDYLYSIPKPSLTLPASSPLQKQCYYLAK